MMQRALLAGLLTVVLAACSTRAAVPQSTSATPQTTSVTLVIAGMT